MDWFPSHRHVHVVPRYGQRLHNEDQHVRSHSGHGQPDGAGEGPDNSGRRMRGLLHTRREHNRTREYTILPPHNITETILLERRK
jgi:hypothetical protein